MATTTNPPESPAPEPLWLPSGQNFQALPPALQFAVQTIINPAYQELVVQAPTALERTASLSFLHLLWLELIEQYELGKLLWKKGPSQNTAEIYQQMVPRHLTLINAKDKLAKFLLQAKVFHEKYGT